MKSGKRFIKSIVKASAETEIAMPWQRGARRAAFIAKRKEAPAQLKRA